MELLWNTVNVNKHLLKLLKGRELREDNGRTLQHNSQFTASLLKRLDLNYNLEGHQGCVNCLQWSADGRTLASGSDDTHIRIWDPFVNKSLHTVRTKHIGNIFSVKFVGDGSLVASGAGDCRVIVQPIDGSDKQALIDCNCHAGRVKRLATAPDQPSLFWSAAEDGLIIQYDLREQHECVKNSTVFVDLSHSREFKCITVNPTKPHLIAVGANDSYVRLYDRRLVKTSKIKPNHPFDSRKRAPLDFSCVQYFAPGHLAKDNGGEQSFKLATTYVTFDATGNELLVNMGGEHIYLFNINNNRHINELKIPQCLPKTDTASPVKPCCVKDTLMPDQEVHLYNYTFKDRNPCACDFMERATRIYKRGWIGDVYYAAREYLYVIQHWPDNPRAYLGLIECLVCLKWPEEATSWVQYFQQKFTSYDSRLLKRYEDELANIQTGKPTTTTTDGIDPESFEALEVSEDEKVLRADSIDYELRYIGHCNTTTDIKEASFLGENFICAGSDDGMIFIWDTKTTNLLTALMGDVSIVNCVQPHPNICYLASSGIDPVVKIWSPKNKDDESYTNSQIIRDLWPALEANQQRMSMNPFETMLVNMGYRVRDNPRQNYTQVASCQTS